MTRCWRGRTPDRPPFSFWYHFAPDADLLAAHREQLDRFGMDFLKVMNDHAYPHSIPIRDAKDLAALGPLRGDEEGFGKQLELLVALKRAVGQRVYVPTTIFNAWMVLRLLVKPPTVYRPPVLDGAADAPSQWTLAAYRQEPTLVDTGLAGYWRKPWHTLPGRCLKAGADGIFLSVRDDWVDTPATAGLLRQSGAANGLGDPRGGQGRTVQHPARVRQGGGLPRVRAVPRARGALGGSRSAGPSIREVAGWLKPSAGGGAWTTLGTLATGTPEQVRAEVVDALRQAGARPMIIAPGCTFDPEKVPEANLRAIATA